MVRIVQSGIVRQIKIGTYRNVIDAQLVKSALEAAGLRVTLAGDEVRVDERDADAAEQIVNAMIGIAHAEHIGPGDAGPYAPPTQCPNCGSPDVVRRPKLPSFALVVALAIGIGLAIDNSMAAFFVCLAAAVVFIAAEPWRCSLCGNTWS